MRHRRFETYLRCGWRGSRQSARCLVRNETDRSGSVTHDPNTISGSRVDGITHHRLIGAFRCRSTFPEDQHRLAACLIEIEGREAHHRQFAAGIRIFLRQRPYVCPSRSGSEVSLKGAIVSITAVIPSLLVRARRCARSDEAKKVSVASAKRIGEPVGRDGGTQDYRRRTRQPPRPASPDHFQSPQGLTSTCTLLW